MKEKKKFTASIPRRRYLDGDIGSAQRCPECQGALEKEFHTYLMVIKKGREMTPFLFGNDGGHFCFKCPVVVLEHDVFVDGIMAAGETKAKQFTVAGIVNLEAIPDDKKHLPIGADDNPIPLVEFLNTETGSTKSSQPHAITRKKRRQLEHHLRQKKKKR